METASKKHDKASRGHDALPSGALAEPVVRMTVDRPYPSGMGLQPLRPLGAADPYKVLLTDV